MKKYGIPLLALLLHGTGFGAPAPAGPGFGIIPRPAAIEVQEGCFLITPETTIVCDNQTKQAATFLSDSLAPAMGFSLKVVESSQSKDGGIVFRSHGKKGLAEAYQLTVTPKKIEVVSANGKGAFYACQTLRQLLPAAAFQKTPSDTRWAIPSVKIQDTPRFGWRGLMIDSSRTFWSVDFTKRYIDLISLYKMNVLHMHLTDDQGWRLEIKKHPKLTELGSTFAPKYNEPAERQGFYTQDQIRELVAYAAARNVTLVPEIEMPGHTLALLNAYPELSCTGEVHDIHTFTQGPGIHQEIFCAGNDKTFELLEDIIDEVVALFPSEYIHIGGDEAPKHRWKNCPKCQQRIKDEILADEHELQSWFITRMERYINSKGRKLIGWDEILEGGLAPNAAVMSWRGIAGGKKAAQMKHSAVMTPTSHCYFDYSPQRFNSRHVYSFEPIPEGLTPEQSQYILGTQANFWSHLDRTEARMDKQIFPRLRALAEVAWTPKELKNWEDYKRRADYDLKRLDLLEVHYSPQDKDAL